MVLTQRGDLPMDIPVGDVSIPLWFSRNRYKGPASITEIAVSIPLWFSRNGKKTSFRTLFTSFHTTMVLTQRENVNLT